MLCRNVTARITDCGKSCAVYPSCFACPNYGTFISDLLLPYLLLQEDSTSAALAAAAPTIS